MQCVLNLGDIIDGKCADIERYGGGSFEDEKMMETDNRRQQAVDDVLQALGSYTYGRLIHTYGEFSATPNKTMFVCCKWIFI